MQQNRYQDKEYNVFSYRFFLKLTQPAINIYYLTQSVKLDVDI